MQPWPPEPVLPNGRLTTQQNTTARHRGPQHLLHLRHTNNTHSPHTRKRQSTDYCSVGNDSSCPTVCLYLHAPNFSFLVSLAWDITFTVCSFTIFQIRTNPKQISSTNQYDIFFSIQINPRFYLRVGQFNILDRTAAFPVNTKNMADILTTGTGKCSASNPTESTCMFLILPSRAFAKNELFRASKPPKNCTALEPILIRPDNKEW